MFWVAINSKTNKIIVLSSDGSLVSFRQTYYNIFPHTTHKITLILLLLYILQAYCTHLLPTPISNVLLCTNRETGGSLAGEQTERNSLKRFRDSNTRGVDKVQELVGLKPELRCLRAMHLGNSWNICRASYTRVARAIKAHRLRRKQNKWTRAPADKAEPSTDTNTTEATFCNMRHVTAITIL